ncbi:MAG TPA: hypothetical protein VF870_11095 [Ignavibacteriaceae bacterium]
MSSHLALYCPFNSIFVDLSDASTYTRNFSTPLLFSGAALAPTAGMARLAVSKTLIKIFFDLFILFAPFCQMYFGSESNLSQPTRFGYWENYRFLVI